ncbi:hypothetical protein [Verrucosispora sp. WMMD1129]|uniref:hypothetical protein n=1 Tax=Verrucosispora sp. WMMD1129 TaxID=3016093 RepID=UPI00249C7B42|nr:hypothetical protein [Verrucosispora sp. WMMD1129]WFE45312.1 hypothetical protein O7624_13605 [Verrucosispora sp. WMMD1129]
MGDLMVARTSGVIMHKGRRHTIRRGQTIGRKGHPVVDGHPRLWEPLRVHYDLPGEGVEQATAAPGELRDLPPVPAGPQRPPTSGPGSGVEAWRKHAAEVTGTPAEQWAGKSRDEIMKALGD